jgi:hypothetical protein
MTRCTFDAVIGRGAFIYRKRLHKSQQRFLVILKFGATGTSSQRGDGRLELIGRSFKLKRRKCQKRIENILWHFACAEFMHLHATSSEQVRL